jgi:hypothetical protein
MTTPSVPDFETMSDEEFLNAAESYAPTAPIPVSRETDSVEAADADTFVAGAGTESVTETQGSTEADAEADAEDESEHDAADGKTPSAEASGHTTPQQPADDGTAAQPPAGTPAAAAAPDFEALYKQVMAPFKANGRDFTPASPEEAIRLMQMGVNYTKKMQGLKPNLKLLRMLENNGLLQEDRIAHLIDLSKGDKGAIQKLLQDGKVDPLDLDVAAESTYRPGNHVVSDADMAFHDALENVLQTPTGKETVKVINADWDPESKNAIFEEPALLEIIDRQRSNGIYAKISAELERRKVLGEFGNVPFIQAYKSVGDELHAAGKLTPPREPDPATKTTTVVSTAPSLAAAQPARELGTRSTRARVQAPAGAAAKALAMAPGSTKSTVVNRSFDPLSMSDEEIMAIKTAF